ncbi:MAG: NosD domain-containing protein [Myxococcota bacterium]
MTANAVAVVIAPSATLRSIGVAPSCEAQFATPRSVPCLIEFNSVDFVWVEGAVIGQAEIAAVMLDDVDFAVVENQRAEQSQYGLWVATSRHVRVRHLRSADHTNYGVIVTFSDDVSIADYSASNIGGAGPGTAGILIEFSSRVLLTGARLFNNTPYNVLVNEAIGLTVAHSTLLNASFADLNIGNSEDVTVVNVVTVNGRRGFRVFDVVGLSARDIVSMHHTADPVAITDTTGVKFEGDLVVGENAATNCVVTGGDGSGPDGAECTQEPTVNVRIGAALSTSSFAGPLTVDEPVNESDFEGLRPAGAPEAWLPLTGGFRAWGPDVTPFPSDSLRGRCVDECRIWDWSLGDASILLNRGVAPVIVESGLPCPAAVAGNQAVEDARGARFLYRAIERMNDGRGNDDGLCESGEACAFLHHFGAVDGAEAEPSQCLFTDGVVSGVEL